MLAAVSAKLRRVDTVLTHGEDERLARVMQSLAARPDFDRDVLRRWLSTLAPAPPAGPPSSATLAAAQNRKNLVVALHAVLTSDTRDLPGIVAARDIVRIALTQHVR